MRLSLCLLRMFLLTIMVIAFAHSEVATEEDTSEWDPAYDHSLFRWKATEGCNPVLTTSSGAVVTSKDTVTLNRNLLLNPNFVDHLTSLVRGRIVERVNHPKAVGAFGEFEVTNDLTHICKADFFKLGKKTPIALRLSNTVGEKGTPDLTRNFNGFALKYYTTEGNFDLVGFNTPMYFYKDPIHFIKASRAVRRNPSTNLYDSNTLWDLVTNVPESLPCFLMAFAGYGYSAGVKHTPGFGIHTFQVENENGDLHFVRFHFVPDAGVKNMDLETIRNNSASDIDYMHANLYREIAEGDYPSWTAYMQILTESEARENDYIAFDVTQFLDKKKYPLHKFGKLILNRNPKNYHAEVEQLALMPGNVVPGIAGAPDKMYESRVFVYRDAQMYRLGANVNKIGVNCPFQTETHTFNRDGVPPVRNNENDDINYPESTFGGAVPSQTIHMKDLITITETKANNTHQATKLYTEEFTEAERQFLIDTIVPSLQGVHSKRVKQRALELLTKVHPELGRQVSEALGCSN